MTPNAEKVRDIAAALTIAGWLAENQEVADDLLLVAAVGLLQRFADSGWQVSRIDSSEARP